MTRYSYRRLPYEPPPETSGRAGRRWPVTIVGAGPIGLAAAIDLALNGVPSVVLDDNDMVSVGSRAICWAKRTLEIFDRLGVGERMLAKGVTWQRGRVFHREREVWNFDLLPEAGHKMPAFINLQQYHVEEYLIDRCQDFSELIELRFKNRVIGLDQRADGATLSVDTPDGAYALVADYVLACDGAGSTLRRLCGLALEGQSFEERFLIADVEMRAEFPAERWFWFEPPFHPGQSALLHKQPDDIWRIDLQLDADADPEIERQPDRVLPRIRALVGDRPFELDWVSVYSFQCRRLARFVHDRILFVGDSAHIVSPFGARGGNGGIQDVDNLIWKLAAVLAGNAPPSLLATYDEERGQAADENIRNAARSARFMTPHSATERAFHDAALDLAAVAPFARGFVNSGRLSVPCGLAGSSLVTEDVDAGGVRPGSPCPDAPVADDGRPWLLDHVRGGFTLLHVADTGTVPPATALPSVIVAKAGATPRANTLVDRDGFVAARYGAGVTYLVRPDQHVAARWRQPTTDAIWAAYNRSVGSDS